MRPIARVLVVATGTVLFIAAGRNPEPPTDARGEIARAAAVVRVQPVQPVRQPSATDQARQAAEAAVSGATARAVEREAGDGKPGSAWEVELVRPDGATVEVDLDAGFTVVATDRDDDRRDA
jgi:uncharacterized membrane protein YkoI